MRRALALVTLVLALAAAAPAVQADGLDPEEWMLHVPADAEPAFTGPDGVAALVAHAPGERAEWALNLTASYTVLEVRVDVDAFDVERARQVVPRLDGMHFTRVPFDVAEAENAVHIFSLNESGDAFTYRLGLPGPGEKAFTLDVDTTPPGFELGEIEQLTHRSFYLETTTTEAALANLEWEPVDGGDAVENPTPSPAGLQKFPIQGLKADTEYVVRLSFEDWSGNVANAAPFTVRTLPEPDLPKPVVTIFQPLGGSYAAHEVPEVRVTIESPESPVHEGGVRFFFDKQELRENWTIADGILRYDPGPLPPGYHSFSVEVTNAAGGESFAVGNFTVEAHETPTPAAVAVIAVIGVAGVAFAGFRRRAA